MKTEVNKIIRTNAMIIVTCKCNSVVAASVIYGGISVDEDFTTTIANVINKGGEASIINSNESSVTMSRCKCI